MLFWSKKIQKTRSFLSCEKERSERKKEVREREKRGRDGRENVRREGDPGGR